MYLNNYTYIYIVINKNQNKMKNINEILNSELLNEMIKEEDRILKEAGWTYKEVKEFAKAFK